jgi:hypothetical protein
MGEYVFTAVVRRDESEALRLVEPLHNACCHSVLQKNEIYASLRPRPANESKEVVEN